MPGFCYSFAVIVHTIGHSTLALPDFLAVLAAHDVRTIADVRRYPASRRHPHFAREALAAALADAGRGYVWLPGLGGRRRSRPDSIHVGWRSDAFRAYADHMDTPEFRAELERLLALAAERPTAILCAEVVPWRCHRQLIADALVARGIVVRHLLGARTAEPHRLTGFARIDGDRVVYDRGQLDLVPGASPAFGSTRDRR
ncbi:MAG TPA: DUF488 domain-containing protein [Candidatus Binatia bacterium]|nr:DUF488 domain-containing protein [Candidatus Binatia bacterium]